MCFIKYCFTNGINQVFKKIALIFSVLLISSCAQDNIKSSDSGMAVTEESEQSKSVSSSDKEKYRDGITALYNNDLSKAQRIFSEFVRNKPKLAGAYSNLALVYFKKEEFDKSLKQLNKALELNPKQAQAYNLRAQLYVVDGKIHEAKADYLKAIEYKPKYTNAQYNLALLYDVYLQEINLAIKHYKIYMSLIKEPDEATKEWITHLEGTLKDA